MPITITVDALRVFCLGGPTAEPALAVPAVVIRYRHITST